MSAAAEQADAEEARFGYRSATIPPISTPSSPARTIPISEPQTYSELPKSGARTRLEAIIGDGFRPR